MKNMDHNESRSSVENSVLLSNKDSQKIYYLAIFAGVAMNTITYVVMGWVAVFISLAYQSNDSMEYFPEWIQFIGDSVFIISILAGSFVAARIADSSEILNALCVGVFDILFTTLQLGLFERLYSDFKFLLIKSLLVILLSALGGYLALLRKKQATQSLTDYFEKK